MYATCHNFRVAKEIGVEEHDSAVKFYIRSENMAVSRMRSEKYPT